MSSSMREYAVGVRLLHDELRQIRHHADIAATGAIVHHLWNCVASAQAGLGMAEHCLEGGDTAALESLLPSVQEALRDARALIVQARAPSGPRRLIPS